MISPLQHLGGDAAGNQRLRLMQRPTAKSGRFPAPIEPDIGRD
jgi:hypothetical protein